MKKEILTSITKKELTVYIQLYEKIAFLETVRQICESETDTFKMEIDFQIKEYLNKMRQWWRNVDEKYFLIHSDRGKMKVDTYKACIYLII